MKKEMEEKESKATEKKENMAKKLGKKSVKEYEGKAMDFVKSKIK